LGGRGQAREEEGEEARVVMGWQGVGLRWWGKQIPKGNDRKKGKGNGKSNYGGPSLRSG